jgi:hypothetical protein
MDTIAKAENVMAGTIFSFNMNKRFNPLCLWKSAVRGLNTFKKKLLYVAAVNKKVAPLKSH